MSKTIIAVVFASGLIAGITLNVSSKSSQAAADLPSCVIPKAYGSVKAAGSTYLVFEGSDGTIPLVNDACQTVRVIGRNRS
jgi:hypothetical protein